MVLSFFGMRAASCRNDQMKRSSDQDSRITTGPSPSLWPEPARPIPIPTRRVQFNTSSKTPNRAGRDLEGTLFRQQGRPYPECAVSSGSSTPTLMDSGSTLPSSYSTSHTPPVISNERPLSNVFEPCYPKWYSYPPIHPTEFESSKPISESISKPISTPKGDPIDTTNTFLRRSRHFQDWVNEKNAERIQLRHSPDYEHLLYLLHKYEYIAEHAPEPPTRTTARQRLLKIKKAMAEERERLAPAELQHIRDIEKAWVSFVSLESYEREADRQRHASMIVQVDPTRPLSKIERLLGSDGSSLGTSSFIQPSSSTRQTTLSQTSGGGAMAESTDVNGYDLKGRLASAENIGSWPVRPREILIPEWFPIVDATGKIKKIKGITAEERFTSLLNYICHLSIGKSQYEYKEKHPEEEGIIENRSWDKNWHDPNPGWRYEHHRKRGGWWKCRRGPTATAAENRCRPCREDEPVSAPRAPPAQELDDIIGQIEAAMAIVTADDKGKIAMSIVETFGPGVLRQPASENRETRSFREDGWVSARYHETTQSGSRQPFINYNPLRGLDDSSEAMARSRPSKQQAAPTSEKQEIIRNEDDQKDKQVSK
ncbi:hypothetical protein F5Y14DRAFT_37146 [Nemania sp. NC0429]|nr:hypothetical protein F5Y14DRAFT_37146 [Nemania sp. NC0429]